MLTRLLAFFSLALLAARAEDIVTLAPSPAAHTDVAYVAEGHARQKLDVFLPPGAAEKNPLIVWIHGGAWIGGDKRNARPMGMLGQGWVVASLNYRYSNQAIFPAQIEDCKAAIRFLRAHAAEYKIDPARIAVIGESAGGHLVSLLGTTGHVRDFEVGAHLDQSSAVACVIDIYGPTDFLNWGGTSTIAADDPNGVLAKLFGGPISERRELAKKGSPITYVSKESAPHLILHGDKDELVPLAQSTMLDAALRQAGVESVLKVFPGAGHGGPAFGAKETIAAMREFLEKHAGRKAPAKAPPAAGAK